MDKIATGGNPLLLGGVEFYKARHGIPYDFVYAYSEVGGRPAKHVLENNTCRADERHWLLLVVVGCDVALEETHERVVYQPVNIGVIQMFGQEG